MNMQDALMMMEANRKYSELQVLQSVESLRRSLDKVEQNVKDGEPRTDNAFQGNEWRLYKELANLERYTEFINTFK